MIFRRIKKNYLKKKKILNIFYIISNTLFLILNIYFLLYNNINVNISKSKTLNYKKFLSNLKDIDKYIFSLLSNSFLNIGYHLTNKYKIYKKLIKIKKRKKIIKYYGVNLNDEKAFKQKMKILLKNKFRIKYDKHRPDYLFFNVFGKEELNSKYNNTIKIAYFTENAIPDFFQCDYAIGHPHITFLDRYFKYPFSFILTLKNLDPQHLKEIRNNAIKNQRKKFCAAVISDVFPHINDFFRLDFIKKLNKYKFIDMGGRYNNTIGGPIQNKTKFLFEYKFSIAMENSKGDGYTTEKILDSFYSGTIPIYYGDYMVDEYINPKTYILIKGVMDLEQKIEYIKKIDNNDELYRRIMKEEVFNNKKIIEITEKEHSDFLIHIFSQDKDKAKRN